MTPIHRSLTLALRGTLLAAVVLGGVAQADLRSARAVPSVGDTTVRPGPSQTWPGAPRSWSGQP
jgi:hypothetical protein